MTLAHASRIAFLSLVVGLLAMTGIATGSAQGATATASARAAARICTKRARVSAVSTSTAQRRTAVRRCIVRFRRSYSRDTNPPTVAWKTPAGGASVSGKLQGAACEVSASDDRGVYRVVFKVDGTTLNTESDAPWNCIFDTTKVADGSHTVTATAYDAAGNSSSASLNVNVANKPVSSEPALEPAAEPAPIPTADTTAPAVAWQVPSTGSTIGGLLQGSACEVSASDGRGVEKVVFKVDGTTLNTESDAPWNCIFDTTKVADGSHTVTATAYDAAGNSSSASRSFDVLNAVAPSPAPAPEPAPAPSPSGMMVGLDAGNYGSSGAADVRGAVNTVRYDTDRGVTGLESFKRAGLRIQMNFSGPYDSGGVCALNASAWVSETLAFYKANTNPTQAPAIEVLNEPGGTWFWGSGAESSTNAVCYRNLLKKTHEAFHATYGESAPKILGTLDGPNGLTFGRGWLTSDWATYVDGFIVHPYGGTGSRTGSALGNRALVESARAMTGGPIYITEVGWPTAVGQPSTGDSLQWTESEQAANITSFIAWAHNTGYVAEVDYFNYRDYGTNAWYGVVRSDGSHKPAYEALRQAAATYGS
jgi:hypothetical protein